MEMFGVDGDDRETSVRHVAARLFNWNTALAIGARQFASPKQTPLSSHYLPHLKEDSDALPPIATAEGQINEGVSVMFFSSYEFLSAVLDRPKAYDLLEADINKMDGSIWVDHIHPTSMVHDLLARDLSRFLNKLS